MGDGEQRVASGGGDGGAQGVNTGTDGVCAKALH